MKRYVLVLAAASLAWHAASAQPIAARVTLTGTTVAVQPDPIEVKRARGAVVIRWELPPDANYSFDPNGIEINGERVGGQLRPQNQIGNCGGGPKHMTCSNANSRKGTFKYTVRLRDANGRLVEHDPFIVNQE